MNGRIQAFGSSALMKHIDWIYWLIIASSSNVFVSLIVVEYCWASTVQGPSQCLETRTQTNVMLMFPTYLYGLSLSLSFLCLSSSPPRSFFCAPGLRFGRGMWMDGCTTGWMDPTLAFSLSSNLRTQLPGETTMTPPPHTRPAHRGPPVGGTLHRAATTAANLVGLHRNGHVHTMHLHIMVHR